MSDDDISLTDRSGCSMRADSANQDVLRMYETVSANYWKLYS